MVHRHRSAINRTHGNGGFTIAEAVLVVVMLGVLLIIISVSVGNLRKESSAIDCRSERRVLTGAVQRFIADAGRAPQTKTELFNVGYLGEDDAPHLDFRVEGEKVNIRPIGSTCS